MKHPLEGATVARVVFDARVETHYSWLTPEDDLHDRLFVRDGQVYGEHDVELAIETIDGRVFTANTCGCCCGIGGELGDADRIL
jgi:hypothetical protein